MDAALARNAVRDRIVAIALYNITVRGQGTAVSLAVTRKRIRQKSMVVRSHRVTATNITQLYTGSPQYTLDINVHWSRPDTISTTTRTAGMLLIKAMSTCVETPAASPLRLFPPCWPPSAWGGLVSVATLDGNSAMTASVYLCTNNSKERRWSWL